MNVDVARDIKVHELAAKMFGAEDERSGDDFILQDFLAVIEIMEKKIQRGDTLDEAGFEFGPFATWNNARDEVEGENALGALGIVVDGERDAAAQERQVHGGAALVEVGGGERGKTLGEAAIMRADGLTVGLKHLVEKRAGVVVGADERHVLGFGLRVVPEQVLCQSSSVGLVLVICAWRSWEPVDGCKKIPAGEGGDFGGFTA